MGTLAVSPRLRVTLGAAAVAALGVALVSSFWTASRTERPADQAPAAVGELIDPARVRAPAVAGQFYPADPAQLAAQVDGYLAAAPTARLPRLRALVVPHAGYPYSGPTAGVAFHQIQPHAFDEVFVLGPSHHVPFVGVSIPDVDAYRTPLGLVRLSPRAAELRQSSPFTTVAAAHESEHSLEVELPFLQRALGTFQLVPLVFGKVDERAVAQVLAKQLTDRTLVVASSDLSHYYPDEVAREKDQACITAVTGLDIPAMSDVEACGKRPILALMHLARMEGWQARVLDYKNSGDTAGGKDRVVGYAAIAFFEAD